MKIVVRLQNVAKIGHSGGLCLGAFFGTGFTLRSAMANPDDRSQCAETTLDTDAKETVNGFFRGLAEVREVDAAARLADATKASVLRVDAFISSACTRSLAIFLFAPRYSANKKLGGYAIGLREYGNKREVNAMPPFVLVASNGSLRKRATKPVEFNSLFFCHKQGMYNG